MSQQVLAFHRFPAYCKALDENLIQLKVSPAGMSVWYTVACLWPDPNSSMSFTELPDVCIQLIVGQIELLDAISLSYTCRRLFVQATGACLLRSFRTAAALLLPGNFAAVIGCALSGALTFHLHKFIFLPRSSLCKSLLINAGYASALPRLQALACNINNMHTSSSSSSHLRSCVCLLQQQSSALQLQQQAVGATSSCSQHGSSSS
jgi:hypothetical protein